MSRCPALVIAAPAYHGFNITAARINSHQCSLGLHNAICIFAIRRQMSKCVFRRLLHRQIQGGIYFQAFFINGVSAIFINKRLDNMINKVGSCFIGFIIVALPRS